MVVLSDDLEGSEQFGKQKFAAFLPSKVLDWDIDCRWRVRTVDGRNRVVFERETAPENLGAV